MNCCERFWKGFGPPNMAPPPNMSLLGSSAFSGNASLLLLIKESIGFSTSADIVLSIIFSADSLVNVFSSVDGFVSLALLS